MLQQPTRIVREDVDFACCSRRVRDRRAARSARQLLAISHPDEPAVRAAREVVSAHVVTQAARVLGRLQGWQASGDAARMPPQHGKSMAVIDFIAWAIGHDPELRVIFSSFSDRLGIRANLRLQRTLDSTFYKRIFPDTRIEQHAHRAPSQSAICAITRCSSSSVTTATSATPPCSVRSQVRRSTSA